MTFTEDEIDRVVAGIRGGEEVVVGGSRCHQTYGSRGGELFIEDFDEGATQMSVCTEAELRATIARNPDDFIEVLRKPLRHALSEALLGITSDSPFARLRELIHYGECLQRRHLLEAVLAWPEPSSAQAAAELASLHSGLDVFHFVSEAIGYGRRSVPAGEFGLRVFSTLAEMLGGRELPRWRHYRAHFHELTENDAKAIEDLEWEYARLAPNDLLRPDVARQLAKLTDRHISAQIIAASDDDGPRLVWADQLTERGDPRGEFIVAQCTLARTDPDDPIHASLGPRAQQLLAFHEWDWGAKHGCRFERGFVASIPVRWTTFAEEANAVFAWAPPLRELRFCVLPGDYVANAVEVLDDPRLERLRSLDCSEPIFRIDNATFSDVVLPFPDVEVALGSEIVARLDGRLRNLESLGLRNARLEPKDIVLLGKRDGLERLDLSKNDLKGDDVAPLAGLSRLEELDLSGSWISALPGLSNLRRLRVRGCTNEVLANRALTSLEVLDVGFDGPLAPTLRRLKLGPGVVPRLTELTQLWELELQEAQFAIDRLPSVLSLRLRGCHLGDAGLAKLVAHPMFERLELLDLEMNDVSPEGARILARAPRLPQRLLLRGNLLGDAGARALAEAKTGTRLTELDLGDNGITDEGARIVALDSPNLSQLGRLRLEGNPISPDTRQECYNHLGHRLV